MRFALGLEYDGTHYFGWQRQRNHLSIQAQLEAAISRVANEPIATVCAGRTDAKVHAFAQVVHFDTVACRSEQGWLRGINTYLPRDIRVKWIKEVPPEFDARKAALSRRYCYLIVNQPVSPGILRHAATWVYTALDINKMQEAANFLLGTHDFSAFRAAECQAKTPIRTISEIQFLPIRGNIILDIMGNAFLHHMVRNIMGSLILVGKQKKEASWIADVLASRDRRQAGMMAPPEGLYLSEVVYPQHFNLPKCASLPWFL
jgi:tRNA pseudouridine38-40 synthase